MSLNSIPKLQPSHFNGKNMFSEYTGSTSHLKKAKDVMVMHSKEEALLLDHASTSATFREETRQLSKLEASLLNQKLCVTKRVSKIQFSIAQTLPGDVLLKYVCTDYYSHLKVQRNLSPITTLFSILLS